MRASALRVIVALAPVALSAAYLFYAKRALARKTISQVRVSPPEGLLPLLGGNDKATNEDVIPRDVLNNAEAFVVARERVVSLPIPIAELQEGFIAGNGGVLEGALVKAYLGATMRAFAWTPQALVMARLGAKLEGYSMTFEARYLSECAFGVGDRVCGVYVVKARREGRAVLGLSPPPGWTGPVVTGVLDVGFDLVDGDKVQFVNETTLWRGVGDKPTLLEGSVGRWLHTLMASWLVVQGIKAVTV
ncbi:uncharacterized protein GGS22DRAFT_172430 [Annulohypoxylon maeteangense]|uniref:uncharacterized protein n=1 Tax=Annulohypoxylon maeteangense TaxID=1927788 RepID=UPI002008D142|nr:uncharacterized protein GGS22DRAFT_172430 [Annulohypoxylon maeteangense]KAI0881535.1 hypothetical protein GGS22DRAFT_172430 [Annulohypoxylon maeteangense]